MLQCKLFSFMYMSAFSIELEVQEVELEGLEWIYLPLDRDQFLAFMNVIMERLLTQNCLWNYQHHNTLCAECGLVILCVKCLFIYTYLKLNMGNTLFCHFQQYSSRTTQTKAISKTHAIMVSHMKFEKTKSIPSIPS
jgi:hypothetical protein